MIDFSAEEHRAKLSLLLNKVKSLNETHNNLKEQLFFLNLHQEVSRLQYQKCLQRIGEHKRIISEPRTTINLPDITGIEQFEIDQHTINEMKENLEKYIIEINHHKEAFFILEKKRKLLESVLRNMKNCKLEDVEVFDRKLIEEIYARVNEKKKRKIELEMEYESVYRDLHKSLISQKLLQEHLDTLLEKSEELVKERKWHCSVPNDTNKEVILSFFKSSLSIP